MSSNQQKQLVSALFRKNVYPHTVSNIRVEETHISWVFLTGSYAYTAADVAEDVAHLSMDLDYHKRDDLRKYFISQYIMKSNDVKLSRLVYFLMCYKACVRAKVSLFRARNEKTFSKTKEWNVIGNRKTIFH